MSQCELSFCCFHRKKDIFFSGIYRESQVRSLVWFWAEDKKKNGQCRNRHNVIRDSHNQLPQIKVEFRYSRHCWTIKINSNCFCTCVQFRFRSILYFFFFVCKFRNKRWFHQKHFKITYTWKRPKGFSFSFYVWWHRYYFPTMYWKFWHCSQTSTSINRCKIVSINTTNKKTCFVAPFEFIRAEKKKKTNSNP